MAEVDRVLVDDYHIDLLQLMENAGRALARLARSRFFGGDPRGKRIIVLAGTGGNGGGALVCARRLQGWGADVRVCLIAADEAYSTVAAHQLKICRRIGIGVARAGALVAGPAELIVDGIIGYSLRAAPRGGAAELIQRTRGCVAPILSLDVPSGLDATSGQVFGSAVAATATMTLALPKSGLRVAAALPYVGELYLADIGVPPSLYAEPSLGLDIGPIFAREEIIRLV